MISLYLTLVSLGDILTSVNDIFRLMQSQFSHYSQECM